MRNGITLLLTAEGLGEDDRRIDNKLMVVEHLVILLVILQNVFYFIPIKITLLTFVMYVSNADIYFITIYESFHSFYT